MNDHLQTLVEALREELKQYGEMLALLDHQQELVLNRQTTELMDSVAGVNAQSEVIRSARRDREKCQSHLARRLNLNESADFEALLPLLPSDYRPLLQALVGENNELLVRVQQRARQNHLLLSRAVDLMQRFINTLVPGAPPVTYGQTGIVGAMVSPQNSMFQAVG